MLPRMFPYDSYLRASHEKIYTVLYAMPRSELRNELLASQDKDTKFVVLAYAVRIVEAKFLLWSVFTNDRSRWMSA